MNHGTGPSWHLIAGPTGAGKTTYARRLAGELGTLCFSIDEWMNTLFWQDCPQKNDLPWALDRVSRCEQQSTLIANQLRERGLSAVFDMGFTTVSQREPWLSRALAAGAPLILHVLDTPTELRWERVQSRNNAGSGTFSFEVTLEMFNLIDAMWESPAVPECKRYAEVIWRRT